MLINRLDGNRIRLYAGWGLILKWPRIYRAARARWRHGIVLVGPIPIRRW